MNNNFRVIELPQEEYFSVKVQGKGEVLIKREDDGIVVDIYPDNPQCTEPVVSTWAHDSELLGTKSVGKRYEYRCKYCKSTNVEVRSFSRWNVRKQRFEFTECAEDDDWCADCDELTYAAIFEIGDMSQPWTDNHWADEV